MRKSKSVSEIGRKARLRCESLESRTLPALGSFLFAEGIIQCICTDDADSIQFDPDPLTQSLRVTFNDQIYQVPADEVKSVRILNFSANDKTSADPDLEVPIFVEGVTDSQIIFGWLNTNLTPQDPENWDILRVVTTDKAFLFGESLPWNSLGSITDNTQSTPDAPGVNSSGSAEVILACELDSATQSPASSGSSSYSGLNMARQNDGVMAGGTMNDLPVSGAAGSGLVHLAAKEYTPGPEPQTKIHKPGCN